MQTEKILKKVTEINEAVSKSGATCREAFMYNDTF